MRLFYRTASDPFNIVFLHIHKEKSNRNSDENGAGRKGLEPNVDPVLSQHREETDSYCVLICRISKNDLGKDKVHPWPDKGC